MNGSWAFVAEALRALETDLRERGELRNAQLATVTAEGRPALRTLVLRGFERGSGEGGAESVIEAHCDARSGKVGEIEAGPAVALLAWSAERQLQLRFDGQAALHRGDDLARRRWNALPDAARKPYGLVPEPGQACPGPNDGSHLPEAQRLALFTVIRVTLAGVDVLRLLPEGGQMRARGRFTGDGLRAEWVGA